MKLNSGFFKWFAIAALALGLIGGALIFVQTEEPIVFAYIAIGIILYVVPVLGIYAVLKNQEKIMDDTQKDKSK